MSETPVQPQPARPTLREAAWVWARVAALSFGGPAGQIAVMHRVLVDEKKWIDEARFLHGLNYCMVLPGPEAQQLATYIGWLLHRTRGGLVAGLLFILPGFLSILGLSILYALWREQPLVAGIFYGLKPAVLAVVVDATLRVGKRALKTQFMVGMAGLAFGMIFFLNVPFYLIVLGAGVVGWIRGRLTPGVALMDEEAFRSTEGDTRPRLTTTAWTILAWLLVWWVPLALVAYASGTGSIYTQMGLFFSKVACVTFGGAYSVLAYVAQHAVEQQHWLSAPDMLVGLSLAETTPGPLIMVLQFVGFMGAYHTHGTIGAGVLASCVAVHATFAPCFLWIFAGAPYVESMRRNKSLAGALSTVTAAVVGVILNLAVWFAVHVLFARVNDVRYGPIHVPFPDVRTTDWPAVGIALVAFVLIFRFKINLIWTLLVCAGIGLVVKL